MALSLSSPLHLLLSPPHLLSGSGSKLAIRQRKSSPFFRSQRGAEVGNIFMSLIHTAGLHGVNPFEYLTQLMGNAREVSRAPERWLPWSVVVGSGAAGDMLKA